MPEELEPVGHLDQLVVDIDHLPVVERKLDDLGLARTATDVAPELGLARLPGLTEQTGRPVDLDALLARLRHEFAAERDGWMPVMGKNRWIDAIAGAGHKPMSDGVPEVPDSSEIPTPADAALGQGVRVGVVDTATATGAGPFTPYAGHGLFVTGLIGLQAPAATIVSAPVLDADTGRADSWDVAKAIVRLADQDIDLLNLSIGTYAAFGPPLVLRRAIERVAGRTLVIAAAGNHGDLPILHRGRTSRSAAWPAAQPPTVAVGAHGREPNPRRPDWSPDLPWVTCTAPGVDLVAPFVHGDVLRPGDITPTAFSGWARWSGTSFAAALVSGAIAARTGPNGVTARAAFDAMLQSQEVVTPFVPGS